VSFFKVINNTEGSQHVMHEESKKDFVRVYAEVGSAEKAHAAFQRVSCVVRTRANTLPVSAVPLHWSPPASGV